MCMLNVQMCAWPIEMDVNKTFQNYLLISQFSKEGGCSLMAGEYFEEEHEKLCSVTSMQIFFF